MNSIKTLVTVEARNTSEQHILPAEWHIRDANGRLICKFGNHDRSQSDAHQTAAALNRRQELSANEVLAAMSEEEHENLYSCFPQRAWRTIIPTPTGYKMLSFLEKVKKEVDLYWSPSKKSWQPSDGNYIYERGFLPVCRKIDIAHQIESD